VRFFVLAFRAGVIGFVFALAFVRYLGARLGGRGKTEGDRDLLRGEILARALERLGATFTKLGQIAATRPDVVPEGICRGLARLQDDVPAASLADVRDVFDAELSAEKRKRFTSIEERPIAAASVAQVHRGVLDDGSVVAIKIQRREAAGQIERDLSLMRIFAGTFDLIPGMRFMSVPGAVARFGDALAQQLDFVREADNNRRIAKSFAHDPRIRCPKLFDDLCSRRVLTMEFVDGVKPTEVVDDRPGAAAAGFRCIAKMVFLDGFVHADLHPGNLLFTRDGRIFLIDTGLVAEIAEDLRKPWVETFVAVALGDGRRAAELFYGHAPMVDRTDFAAFSRDIQAHLASLHGRPLAELEVTEAVGGAMAILRKHGVQVDPAFTVVNLAMLVAEGIGKQLDPKFDVFGYVMPYLAEASLLYPTGRAMVRKIPEA
jgi:ubiquinone biosynthesis protein